MLFTQQDTQLTCHGERFADAVSAVVQESSQVCFVELNHHVYLCHFILSVFCCKTDVTGVLIFQDYCYWCQLLFSSNC